MNVVLPTENKFSKTRKIIYISIGIICIIAAFVIIYVQYIKDSKLALVIGKNDMSDDKYQELKMDFDNVFTNTITKIDKTEYSRHYAEKELAFTGYQKKEIKEGYYSLDVNIPYINIKNEKTIEYNKEIISTFQEKSETILNNSNGNNVIYTVDYGAYVEDGILSIIIRSNLKEGTNTQRVIVQTYNYDLINNKEITIYDMLNLKNIDKNLANNKIKKEIQQSQEQIEQLKQLGYTIYERNLEDERYKIENATEFFIGQDEKLYIIYAYGNEEFTSEMDLVIF